MCLKVKVKVFTDASFCLKQRHYSFEQQKNTKENMVYRVFVRELEGRDNTLTIDLCETEEEFKTITVKQLKEKIFEKLQYDDSVRENVWFICGRGLREDSKFLYEYGIKNESTIVVRLRYRGGDPSFQSREDGGMGDKDEDKNRSMENLADFNNDSPQQQEDSCTLL